MTQSSSSPDSFFPEASGSDVSSQALIADALALAGKMEKLFDHPDRAFSDADHKQFQKIANAMVQMRREIARLQANEIVTVRIPEAGRELDAIVEATAGATLTVMEAVETMMSTKTTGGLKGYRKYVEEKCTEILEACSFQDITGQRISKVVETLDHIKLRIRRVAELAGSDEPSPLSGEESAREARKKALILHGPQHAEDAISQSQVDALLSGFDEEGPLTVSQDEVDALFG